MSYSITLDQRVLKSGITENVIVLIDTTGTTDQEVAVAVDYTDYYNRITTAIETLATNSTTIAQKVSTIEDHFNTSGTLNNLAAQLVTLANEITTIDDHLDTQGTTGNFASKITTMSEEITTIDDHLDTQGTTGNLAESIVNIDNHLDVNFSNNLAGKLSNIESHFNSYGSVYSIKVNNPAGKFLENETVTDNNSNTARILKYFEDTVIIDSLSSIFTGNIITGSVSGATADINNITLVKNIGVEVTEYLRQSDVNRLILASTSTNQNRTISYNRTQFNNNLTISSPGNITIDENDVLKFSSVNTGTATNDAENLYITQTSDPVNLENEFIQRDDIIGQGTRSIEWNTTYEDAGTYYWFTESRSRSGTITINYKGYTVDEKIQGNSGGIGYVKNYIPISNIGVRIVDAQAMDIDRSFSIGEGITGTFNNNYADISDVIKLNSGSSNGSSSGSGSGSSPLGEAALYKLYVEEGEILKTNNVVSDSQQSEAIKKINSILQNSRF